MCEKKFTTKVNKMKLYVNSAKEKWVVDRFIEEWKKYNLKTDRQVYIGKKIIWLIAPWTWEKIPSYILKRNKVLCTIHHIDEDKFDDEQFSNFQKRDKFIDHYHVISSKTYQQVSKLTKKPITTIPFWINQDLWFEIKDNNFLYKKYGLSQDNFYIGSFQRDTEGHDLNSPKLSKGPDRFIKIIKDLNKKNLNLEVLLTGKRRNYIIHELEREQINYKYFEMSSFNELNELYNILNLYIVSSRYEGGPASIMECAITKTPIISTDVGIASEILSQESIFNMENFLYAKPNIEIAYKNVEKYKIPNGFEKYNQLLQDIYES